MVFRYEMNEKDRRIVAQHITRAQQLKFSVLQDASLLPHIKYDDNDDGRIKQKEMWKERE